jgi:hypothetical protein
LSNGNVPPTPKPVRARSRARAAKLGEKAESRPKPESMSAARMNPSFRPMQLESVLQNQAPASILQEDGSA